MKGTILNEWFLKDIDVVSGLYHKNLEAVLLTR